MDKKIEIDGKKISFKASAATPRVYRQAFGRDIFQDIEIIRQKEALTVEDMGIAEMISFVMAKQAKNEEIVDAEKEISEWLDGFGVTSIFRAFPSIIGIWADSTKQNIKPKNHPAQQKDK